MSGSVRFDRAAEIYDQTRAISAEAMARTTELLAAEFDGRGRVLEVGVGTGLLALPLHEAGVRLAGLDLTAAMVAKLVEKAGGSPPFPLVLADATRMPFADGVFGGAYLRWVLHLIPDWPGVLAETARVVRPGGVFLIELGAYDETRFEIQQRFGRLAGVSMDPVGLNWADHGPLDAEMARHGAALRILPPVHETWEDALGEFIDGIAEGRYSWTWTVPDDARRRVVAELRPWAAERFGALDEVRRSTLPQVWRAYDLPNSR
jgi:SAM-dependent methyltransferase